MRQIFTHIYVYWALSGLCFALAFPVSWTWPLIVPGLWLWIEAVRRTKRLRTLWLGTWLVGTLKVAGAIGWFWSVYPLDWLGFDAHFVQLFVIGVYWLLTAAAMGLGFSVLGVLTWYLRRALAEGLWLMLVPLIWVLADVLGSLTFSLYSLGPHITPNVYFSFGYVGYLMVDLPTMAVIAKLGGVYLLSAVAIALSIAVLVGVKLVRVPTKLLYGLLVAIVGVYGVSYWWSVTRPPITTDRNVVAINTDFNHLRFQNRYTELERLAEVEREVKAALVGGADVVVLPEVAQFTDGFASPEHAYAFVATHAGDRPVVVVDSKTMGDNEERIIRGFIYDTASASIYTIDKQYLVPQGEFIPYLHGALLNLVLPDQVARDLHLKGNYRPGPLQSYDHIPEHIPPLLFCSASFSPLHVRKLLAEQPHSVVLHQSSHSWFHEPESLWLALDRMLQVHSLWNNVVIVEAGNLKPSAVYPRER